MIAGTQSGFRKRKSTDLALLNLKEMILEYTKDLKTTPEIFLNFSKAFGWISHSVLLDIFHMYGIRRNPLLLIRFYPEYRRQLVSVSGHSYLVQKIKPGVPLPFIVYINDIVKIDTTHFIPYVDDTTPLFSDTPGSCVTNKKENLMTSPQSFIRGVKITL